MNRRHSKLGRGFETLWARLWQMRRVLLLAVPYVILLGWLYGAKSSGDVRPAELYESRETPLWDAPGPGHWFGTAANGADLLELSRLAMASSVSIAVVTVGAGIGLALLLVSLFLFDERPNRFFWIESASRTTGVLPVMVGLVLFLGTARGGVFLEMIALSVAVAFHLAPVLAAWFREEECDFHILASRLAGQTRGELVRRRTFPAVLRRLPGTFAVLVPQVLLGEMALSFLGLTGERLGVGAMVARGQDYLIEAPWMTIYPGLFAAGIVLIFSLLGWRISTALKTGLIPRFAAS